LDLCKVKKNVWKKASGGEKKRMGRAFFGVKVHGFAAFKGEIGRECWNNG